jgi:hypothetical protein
VSAVYIRFLQSPSWVSPLLPQRWYTTPMRGRAPLRLPSGRKDLQLGAFLAGHAAARDAAAAKAETHGCSCGDLIGPRHAARVAAGEEEHDPDCPVALARQIREGV